MDSSTSTANVPSELSKASIIYVIGGPAVGKGTHCKRLVGDCDATHVSVGDLLRAEAEKPEAKDKTIIQGRMQEGSLAPTNLVGKVLEGFLVHMVKGGHRKFLVDGFPRSMEQALDFESRGCNIKAVLHFDSTEETMRSRMMKRAGNERRIDDTYEIHKKRYRAFVEQSKPIINYYNRCGTYFKVDCDQDFSEVYPSIQSLVDMCWLL